jgi:hypothetical protein
MVMDDDSDVKASFHILLKVTLLPVLGRLKESAKLFARTSDFQVNIQINYHQTLWYTPYSDLEEERRSMKTKKVGRLLSRCRVE